MFLDFDTVKKITTGVIEITENDGHFSFRRMTARIYDAYAPSAADVLKCSATAGVRLDFYTDSQYLKFGFKAKIGSGRKYYFFDVYVDGVMTEHMGERNMWILEGRVNVKLPEGRHRVTVYLPNLACAELYDIELSDGALIESVTKKMKMLCLGDSITQGYDAEYPSLSYANIIADEFDAYMINQAIGGDRFHASHIDEYMDFTPEVVTVAYGTNDWSGALKENFDREMPEYLAKLSGLYPDAKIFVITPLWRFDGTKVTKVGVFGDAIKQIADEASKYPNMIVIDGYVLTPHVCEFYADLRLHPNDLGFTIYARNLIAQMKKYL